MRLLLSSAILMCALGSSSTGQARWSRHPQQARVPTEPAGVPAGGSDGSSAPRRISHVVPGLYKAIATTSRLPRGWKIEDNIEPHSRTSTRARTWVMHENGGRGLFWRHYEADSKSLYLSRATLNSAHSDADIPSWIPGKTPLVSGKGIPTVVYFTLRQMKIMKIPYGGLRFLKSDINNYESRVDVTELKSRGLSMEQAVKETGSYRYMETIATQSGHRIVGVKGEWQSVEAQPERLQLTKIDLQLAPLTH